MIRKPNLLGMAILVVAVSLQSCHGGDTDWDYTDRGKSGVSLIAAGEAGNFRSYRAVTNDRVEEVVKWYSERLGLPKDHSLVKAAEDGFSNLKNDHIISGGYGHDTRARKDNTTLVALLSKDHVHITFLHRPNFNGQEDVTISITTAPQGKTSICVIRPVRD